MSLELNPITVRPFGWFANSCLLIPRTDLPTIATRDHRVRVIGLSETGQARDLQMTPLGQSTPDSIWRFSELQTPIQTILGALSVSTLVCQSGESGSSL